MKSVSGGRTMKRVPLLVSFLVVAAAFDAPASAQSLWQRGYANRTSLISDNRARRIGDVISILVSEKQDVKADEKNNLSKSTSTKADVKSVPASAKTAVGKVFPLEWTSDRSLDSKNDYEKKGLYQTTISATVVDVQPNGNLVVEGRRKVTIDGEEKWMTLTGVVRTIDVTAANAVRSDQVANATLKYESCGPLARNTKRGWFEAIIDFIWPF
jgi:flagellar L-ring protein FlgH